MPLFGLFSKKDDAAEIRKLTKKVQEKFGPPETRQKALQQLRDLGTADAYLALMQRFTIRVDPGVTDQEEKEYVYDALVGAGAPAVAPLKQFIKQNEQPTWTIRALEQLVSEEELVAHLLAVLEHEGPDYSRDPEKKIILLRHLESRKDARIGPAVVPFLEDPSEDVRSAAIAVLGALADESTREALISSLIRAQSDQSERLRRDVAQALVATGFSVKGHAPAVQAALPPGFATDKEGVVHAKKT
jgi:hypothetical protein